MLSALAAGTARASASAPAIVKLRFRVTNLRPGMAFDVFYNGGVVDLTGDITRSFTGAVDGVDYFDGAILMTPAGPKPWSGDLEPFLAVDGASVIGVAKIPQETSVTLTNLDTEQTIEVRDGPFSIPTGLGRDASQPRARGTEIVRCRGSERSCQAKISIPSRYRETIIRLPARDLWLQSVKSFPRGSGVAADLSDGHFVRGRSEFVEKLDALETAPPGSHLTLTFGTFASR